MRFTRLWLGSDLGRALTGLAVVSSLVLGAAVARGASDERLERLPEDERRWLEEEVVYIITDSEREVFLSLETREERERFVEAFWRIRDPNPATKENELYVEHYRRLQHANEKLARETARPGWKTDRGRMYIVLGEPRQLTRFEAHNEIVQCELWTYSALPEKGLPSDFNLLFFRRRGIGEYALYSPVLDGPNALMTGHQFTPAADNREALQLLQRISPELARASLTLDLAEPVDFGSRRPALGTDILLGRIEGSAKRSVRTDYADAHLRYRDRVSTDYSFRYVPNESAFWVLSGPESTPFVHFTIELSPEDFTLQVSDDGSKYYTTLDVTRELRSPDGDVVDVDEKEVYLELSASEFRQGAALPFAYQDAFPAVPGEYQVSVVLRNRAVRQFTVAERPLEVPPTPPSEASLGGVVVGYLHERPLSEGNAPSLRAFQIGYERIYPAVSGLFPIGAQLVTLVQVHHAEAGSRLRLSLLEGETVLDESVRRAEAGSDVALVEKLALLQVPGGRYELRVRLENASGAVVEERTTEVVVSPRSDLARPGFIYRNGFSLTPGRLALARGEQLWSLGRFEEATEELARAVEASGRSLPEASWKLAGALLSAKRAEEALDLLEPLESRFPQQYEVIGGLAYAYYFRQEYSRARELLERASTIRPPDPMLLNALGTTYLELGEREKAVEAFRRSLSLDPSQRAVQELLERMSPESP